MDFLIEAIFILPPGSEWIYWIREGRSGAGKYLARDRCGSRRCPATGEYRVYLRDELVSWLRESQCAWPGRALVDQVSPPTTSGLHQPFNPFAPPPPGSTIGTRRTNKRSNIS